MEDQSDMTMRARRGLSVEERRQRNREEMRAAILDVAREIMREQGAGALNLNEVARRVGITTPALYTYFAGKMALYDALVLIGIRLFRQAEVEIWRTTEPGWERIRAWFELRLRQAQEHPELYHLVFDDPVPGLERSSESMEEVWGLYDDALGALTEVIEAGVIAPGLPAEQALDLLLSLRRGIVAEHLGKRRRIGPPDRFPRLIPHVLDILQAAWSPTVSSEREVNAGSLETGH